MKSTRAALILLNLYLTTIPTGDGRATFSAVEGEHKNISIYVKHWNKGDLMVWQKKENGSFATFAENFGTTTSDNSRYMFMHERLHKGYNITLMIVHVNQSDSGLFRVRANLSDRWYTKKFYLNITAETHNEESVACDNCTFQSELYDMSTQSSEAGNYSCGINYFQDSMFVLVLHMIVYFDKYLFFI